MHEWSTCHESYVAFLQNKKFSTTWMGLEKREKQSVLAQLTQSLEMSAAAERLEAARTLLYILQVAADARLHLFIAGALQGAFMDLEPPLSEVVTECMEEARRVIVAENETEFAEQFTLLQAACNAYLVYEAGLFRVSGGGAARKSHSTRSLARCRISASLCSWKSSNSPSTSASACRVRSPHTRILAR